MTIDIGIFNDKDRSQSQPCYSCSACEADMTEGCNNLQMYSAFTMNVANANASMIFSALDIKTSDNGGSISGAELLKALDRTPVELLVRASRTETLGEGGGMMVWVGINEARAKHYLGMLRKIANEAAKREEMVGWG